ncbi:hypothetical protein EXN00_16650 [Clostridium botulinum]|uniref:hypothetical protein n=1 Tax=Clostridium botulinum TaxID=1491 RepID=UPI000772EBB8|nr:hypothetical protein [Clostridium botulinum]AUN06631.1 hypothetical protein RSJ14_07895 [Clostridium botulinum]MBN3365641.1 hypothetical protein [Clostridium botulinum]MBN3368351.1 hypothetical protein [Clostridium botulinum]MBN3375893.1 hypothetical protein [Clostridium botulinum]MBN3392331.1 hypothetical protein [Clostridium botulinum]
MKAYKVYQQDLMGYEGDIVYCKNYNKAIEVFNSVVKKAIADVAGDIVDKADFGDEIASFREWNKDVEIISRKYPYLLYRKKGLLTAQVFYWERASYEYQEYDIVNSIAILEEIEIIE